MGNAIRSERGSKDFLIVIFKKRGLILRGHTGHLLRDRIIEGEVSTKLEQGSKLETTHLRIVAKETLIAAGRHAFIGVRCVRTQHVIVVVSTLAGTYIHTATHPSNSPICSFTTAEYAYMCVCMYVRSLCVHVCVCL